MLVSSFQPAKQITSAYATPAPACSPLYFDEQKAIYGKISKLFKYSSWPIQKATVLASQ